MRLKYLLLALLLFPLPALAAAFPDKALINDVCQLVADSSGTSPQRSIKAFTLSKGKLDANNDGVEDDVDIEEGGSSNSKSVEITLPSSDDVIELKAKYADNEQESEDLRWMGWASDIKWLKYKGYAFLISYADYQGLLPQYIWYIEADYKTSKLCSFTHKKHPSHVAASKEARSYPWAEALCQQAADEKITSYLPLTQIKDLYFGNETHADQQIIADIANDGKKKKLYLAEYSSGAGAGCGADFFIIDGDHNHIKQKSMAGLSPFSNIFYKAQNVDFGDGGPIAPCNTQNTPQLFTHNGYTFLEEKSSSNALQSTEAMFHNIWLFLPDKSLNFCTIQHHIKTTYSAFTTPFYQASFDCLKATQPIERMICSNKNLAQQDIELAEAFGEEKNEQMLHEQRSWLKSRLTRCNIPINSNKLLSSDEARKATYCLIHLYEDRITTLRAKHS